MPQVKQQNDIELGWNGADGYIRNNGKYGLLFTKPLFSFDYSSIIYSNDDQVDDLTISLDGSILDLTEPQKQEVETYAKTYAVNDPWTPSGSKNYVTALDVVTANNSKVVRFESADGTQTDSQEIVPMSIPAVISMDGDLLKVTKLDGTEYKIKIHENLPEVVSDIVVTSDDRLQITFTDGAKKSYALPTGGTGGNASITVESGADIYAGIETLNLTNCKLSQSDPSSTTAEITPQVSFTKTDGSGNVLADSVSVLPPMQVLSGETGKVVLTVDPKAFAERDNHGYLAALASDTKLMGTSDPKIPRKEVLWFDQTLVSSIYINVDRNNKAIGIEEDDDLDPNITDGTYFFISLYLDSDTIVPAATDLKISLVDKTTKQVWTDYKGQPCEWSGTTKQKQKIGIGFGAWLVKATASKEFQVQIGHNSATGINFLSRANGLSCLCVQSMSTLNSTGRALTQYQLETRHLYYLSTKYYGTLASSGLSAVGSYINQSFTGDEFQITSDGWFLTTYANTGVVIGNDNHIDITANSLGYWDLHKVLNPVDTKAILGKAATIGGTLTDKDDGFNLDVLAYNGNTEWNPEDRIIVSYNNGSPTYAAGWSKVDSLFFSEDVTTGDHTLSKQLTLPASSVKNLALVMSPVSVQLPTHLLLKDAYLRVNTPFTEANLQIKKFTDVPDVDVTLP